MNEIIYQTNFEEWSSVIGKNIYMAEKRMKRLQNQNPFFFLRTALRKVFWQENHKLVLHTNKIVYRSVKKYELRMGTE